MTKDEKQAYDILGKSIRFKNGDYEVGMWWNDPNIHLKNNKALTLQRSESLEKRLIKNPNKAKQYLNTIRKYLELGHATKFNRIYTNKQYDIQQSAPLRHQPEQI